MLEVLFAVECSHVAVPEATEMAMRYYESGNLLWVLQQAWSLIVPLLFLVGGLTGKLGAFSKKWGRNWFFSIVLYLTLFLVLYQLLNIPLDFYGDYIRQHAFGLSTQSVGRWIENYGKQFLVTLLSAFAFIWIFYLLLKKSPRRWWFYGSLVSVGIGFFMMLVQPIWVDPLFNKFSPLKNKELEHQILALAARAKIENGRVYEVDKSADTKALNAYVVGFGQTTRIVLWDTILQRMPPNEILFVMGHEMGHYVLHHIWWGMLYFAFLSFVIFYLIYRSANFLLRRYKKRFGFEALHEIASLPLLLVLMNVFILLFTPLSNYVSRYMEHEADRFGLEITQNNQAAGEAFLILIGENLVNPRPGLLYKVWRSTHPPVGERIDFFNQYCPWKEGGALKYAEYIPNVVQ